MRRRERTTAARAARSRAKVAGILACVVAVGVASRVCAQMVHLPPLVGKDFGDALWSLMFYLLVLLAWPRVRVGVAAAVAMAVASAVEFLKLYHAPWLDGLRADRFAGFLLGHAFLWRDFASYAIGVAVGAVGDLPVQRPPASPSAPA